MMNEKHIRAVDIEEIMSKHPGVKQFFDALLNFSKAQCILSEYIADIGKSGAVDTDEQILEIYAYLSWLKERYDYKNAERLFLETVNLLGQYLEAKGIKLRGIKEEGRS